MCKKCDKMKAELVQLRRFKREHDAQLKKLVGSPTWNEVFGKFTLGYVNNRFNNTQEKYFDGIAQ